jgi:DNA replication and repair protein RecF
VHLGRLTLTQFRNYRQASAEFDDGVQCLLGSNGSGKTNLLDAIHYLSFARSSLNSTDAQNVMNGEQHFVVRGTFLQGNDAFDVGCSYQLSAKKTLIENGIPYSRFSQHLGKYPVVLIAPGDIELVWDGSEIRRKFFDSLISQIDKEFLEHLIAYSAHLKMRNAMLRQFAEKGQVDRDLLDSVDSKMIPAGILVYERRKSFLMEFAPVVARQHRNISGNENEATSINYMSDLNDGEFAHLLEKNLQRDLVLQRTSIGVHRDDFDFLLDGFELKRYGSQGQQKSFLLGLKLAEFEAILGKKGFKPLLLLDDIFDKLDDNRISRLVAMMNQGTFGQIFLTDARPERSVELLKAGGIRSRMFSVESGNLCPR